MIKYWVSARGQHYSWLKPLWQDSSSLDGQMLMIATGKTIETGGCDVQACMHANAMPCVHRVLNTF